MEPKFQTSFIPKKPIGIPAFEGSRGVHRYGLLSSVAAVVFIVTLLSSGGLFFYKNLLARQIAQYDKDITSASAAFQPDTIQDIVDTNLRISAAKNLLSGHTVLSRLLYLLNDLTLKKMRFADLNFNNQDDKMELSVIGEVQTYNALAEEQNIFSQNEFLDNPVFSNFILGDNGYISFHLSTFVDPALISYKRSLETKIETEINQ